MDNIKVSVIMPVYNAAQYLEKSLLFLSKQTLQEIEFVLVNDASTDNSLEIMKAFKTVFPDKFTILSSEKNRGPGGARNIGIKYAKGEYIGFVDSDDYANAEMFKMLYDKAKEKDSDLVMCAYRHKGVDDDVFIETDYFKDGLTSEARERLIEYTGFLWHSIFKKEIIDNMEMLFREKYSYQDIDFLADVYCRVRSVDFVPKSLYLYTDNKKSISHKNRSLAEYKEIVTRCIDAIQHRCEINCCYNDIKMSVDFLIIKISTTIVEVMAANDEITIENVKWFNNYLKSFVPNYLDSSYFKNYRTSHETAPLYDYDDEKFYDNIVEYRKRKLQTL